MFSDIDTYALIGAGQDISEGQWTIGEIALIYIDKGNDRLKVCHEIGVLCGLSGRRVDKIARVAELFLPNLKEWGDWSFGYYERAYSFGEDAYPAMDFLDFYVEEYGRRPTVTEFPMMYAQHIVGKVVADDAPSMPVYEVNDFEMYIGRLRYMSTNHPNRERILYLLDELEGLVSDVNVRITAP